MAAMVQCPPKVVPTGPLPAATQGLADPAVWSSLSCSLLDCQKKFWRLHVQKLQLKKAPKKVSREKQLSLLRAKIDVVAQQIARSEQDCAALSRKVER